MLEVNDLKTHFRTQDGVVKAVDGVSFSLEPGETMGTVCVSVQVRKHKTV
jgi:ABC-type dipeptide/oligopeptide/nickel transport system ATPase component